MKPKISELAERFVSAAEKLEITEGAIAGYLGRLCTLRDIEQNEGEPAHRALADIRHSIAVARQCLVSRLEDDK